MRQAGEGVPQINIISVTIIIITIIILIITIIVIIITIIIIIIILLLILLPLLFLLILLLLRFSQSSPQSYHWEWLRLHVTGLWGRPSSWDLRGSALHPSDAPWSVSVPHWQSAGDCYDPLHGWPMLSVKHSDDLFKTKIYIKWKIFN